MKFTIKIKGDPTLREMEAEDVTVKDGVILLRTLDKVEGEQKGVAAYPIDAVVYVEKKPERGLA